MTALCLIPKEMLHEILNRKVERKRRSTATNNPNFVYNNDWEIPAVSYAVNNSFDYFKILLSDIFLFIYFFFYSGKDLEPIFRRIKLQK